MPDSNPSARRYLEVTEQELQRIVLDIHDGPVQNLFGALSQLTLLRGKLSATAIPPSECLDSLQRAITLLEMSLSEIRDLLGVFRAPEFAKSGLAEIVENIVIQYEASVPIAISLEVAEPLPKDVALPVKIALYRIVQESLANVCRHSGAKSATVKMWAKNKHLIVEITDQGRGFEPPPLDGPQATEQQEHIGLRGMRERAALVDGELTVESRPGTGTRVRLEVPIHER